MNPSQRRTPPKSRQIRWHGANVPQPMRRAHRWRLSFGRRDAHLVGTSRNFLIAPLHTHGISTIGKRMNPRKHANSHVMTASSSNSTLPWIIFKAGSRFFSHLVQRKLWFFFTWPVTNAWGSSLSMILSAVNLSLQKSQFARPDFETSNASTLAITSPQKLWRPRS